MVGARAPGTEQISQLASCFDVSHARRKMMFFEGYGGAYKGSGGPGAVVPGG